MPVLQRPEGEPLNSITIPTSQDGLSGKQLRDKLQEITAWASYVYQEQGIATAMYSIVAVEKRKAGNSEEVLRGYAFIQAYMKRLEQLATAFKMAYDGLSRQVTIRDQDIKVHSTRRVN